MGLTEPPPQPRRGFENTRGVLTRTPLRSFVRRRSWDVLESVSTRPNIRSLKTESQDKPTASHSLLKCHQNAYLDPVGSVLPADKEHSVAAAAACPERLGESRRRRAVNANRAAGPAIGASIDPQIGVCARPDYVVTISRYHDHITKQTTVRLPEELAADAETVARVKGTSVNQLIVDSLAAEIDRVRADKDFTSRAKRLLARDKELLDRLAK